MTCHYDEAFKNICATCRHLIAVETGREFDKILDTEYTLFECKKLKIKTKEFYLMAPVEKDPENTSLKRCPYWEPFCAQEAEGENENE